MSLPSSPRTERSISWNVCRNTSMSLTLTDVCERTTGPAPEQLAGIASNPAAAALLGGICRQQQISPWTRRDAQFRLPREPKPGPAGAPEIMRDVSSVRQTLHLAVLRGTDVLYVARRRAHADGLDGAGRMIPSTRDGVREDVARV